MANETEALRTALALLVAECEQELKVGKLSEKRLALGKARDVLGTARTESMSYDDFMKLMEDDVFKRGELPKDEAGYRVRMWEAYQWGIEAGKDEAIDRIAAFLKQGING